MVGGTAVWEQEGDDSPPGGVRVCRALEAQPRLHRDTSQRYQNSCLFLLQRGRCAPYPCAQACPLPSRRASLSSTVPGCRQATSSTNPSLPWVQGRWGGAGVPLSAGPHAPGSTSSRGGCARGVSCVAWQGGSRPVRLSASMGRACGALTCPGSPPGTCGDRDGAEPPPHHPSSFPAPATAAHHSPRAATASFRTSLFLSSRGLASARITLAL